MPLVPRPIGPLAVCTSAQVTTLPTVGRVRAVNAVCTTVASASALHQEASGEDQHDDDAHPGSNQNDRPQIGPYDDQNDNRSDQPANRIREEPLHRSPFL